MKDSSGEESFLERVKQNLEEGPFFHPASSNPVTKDPRQRGRDSATQRKLGMMLKKFTKRPQARRKKERRRKVVK